MSFDPSAKHPDYVEYLPVWQKCRDATAGQRKIKAGGTAYLPSLAGHEKSSYDAYRERASYFNATGRTVEGMVGMVFRKPIKTDVPATVEPWLDDITLTDENLDDFAAECLREALMARPGVLVDMSALDGIVTQAQADAQQLRPYLTLYKAESIINWERARINGAYRLKNVFLKESYVDAGETKVQIRQLTLDTGYYEQIEWRENNGNWFVHKEVKPLKKAKHSRKFPSFLSRPTSRPSRSARHRSRI